MTAISNTTSSTNLRTLRIKVNEIIAKINTLDSGGASNAYVTSTFITNNAARLLINDRLQIANATAIYQTKSVERAALANTNSYIATRASWSALTSTNTSIRNYVDTKVASVVNSAPVVLDTLKELANALANDANFSTTITNLISTKVSTNTFNLALANTNSYIFSRASWSALTNTNTAIRTLVNDRIQVANVAATYQTIATERAALANTNARFSGYLQVANASSTFQTVAVERAALANTNAYIATKISNSISTTIRTRSIIPESNSVYNLGSETNRFKSLFLSGNTIVLGTANISSSGSQLLVGSEVLVSNTYLTSNYITNSTARLLINDRLQIANAVATYQTKSIERAALANTNAYIATRASWSAITSTNTALRTLINDRLQIANVRSYIQVSNVKSYLANTNAYIASKVDSSTFNLALANTNAYIAYVAANAGEVSNSYLSSTYVTNSSFQSALANTNAYIASVAANSGGATWFALTGTNTALRALISDRLQVANASSTYETKSDANAKLANTNAFIRLQLANTNSYIATKVNTTAFNSALANTNSYIATRATWSALTSTNTSLRTLIGDRIQVANVAAKYATKAYAASNNYVNLLLANTNAYIADVEAAISAANEIVAGAFDYGFISTSADVNLNRDYGTL